MPELPEVETTRRGLAPTVTGQQITRVTVRNRRLRWPVPTTLATTLQHQPIQQLSRRGKYLLWHCDQGTLITHLGMSGYFRILNPDVPPAKHDHIDLVLANQQCIRYCDPRRFGAFVWTANNPLQHPLLSKLGVEPLTQQFNGDYLHTIASKRQCDIKSLIMNHRIVVGVGNIYATESLFAAGIHPTRAANRISHARLDALCRHIKTLLKSAIKAGGTTLRDFHHSDGKPGFFKFHLKVYGRAEQPCPQCGAPIIAITQQQRTTSYCPRCQR